MDKYQIAKALTDKNGNIANSRIKSNSELVNKIKFTYSDSSCLKETIYRILHEVNERPKCLTCGGYVEFLGKRAKPFRQYCSFRCSRSEQTMAKMKATAFERYGGIGYSSKELKEKSENTTISRYGKNYRSEVQQVKAKITKLNRYGDQNYNNRSAAIKHTDYKKISEKSKSTCIERYGVDNYAKTEDGKRRSHTKEAIIKAQETRAKNGTLRRSRIEASLSNYIKENYNFLVEDNKRVYLDGFEIDIYLPELKLSIEVNGDFFHKNPRLYKDPNALANLPRLDKSLLVSDIWKRDADKIELAKSKGIKLIQIWEYDIKNDYDGVKKQLESLFQQTLNT